MSEIATPQTPGELASAIEPVPTFEEVSLQIEAGSFHSERDRQLARATMARLEQAAVPDALLGPALTSLQALIPRQGETEKRQIDGKTIPPAIEARIASRLKGAEVDITAEGGSWGSLPEKVKETIAACSGGLGLEITSQCTVACSFCVADKGPIQSKASFDSVLGVVDYFVRHQPHEDDSGQPWERSDHLYWDTDPFDAKWAASERGYGDFDGLDHSDLDYDDLARAYRERTEGRNRHLFTSTAIPLGEEFRVLNFAIEHLQRNNHPDFRQRSQDEGFRISITPANAGRANHILNIVKALSSNDDQYRRVQVSDVRKKIVPRGERMWESPPDELTTWDILGPNCIDGTIISPKTVYRVYMQGASPESPAGEVKKSVMQRSSDGATVYHVPVAQYKPNVKFSHPSDAYRPVEMYELEYGPNGEFVTSGHYMYPTDPFRALARVAFGIERYRDLTTRRKIGQTIAAADFGAYFRPAVAQIVGHLAGGHENVAMQQVLEMLSENGLR